MSQDQAKFFQLLARFPRLAGFWSAERRECDPDRIGRGLRGDTLSPGERVILKALYSIWCGRAGKHALIDITDLAALDAHIRQPILDWLADPFWP